MTTCHVCGTKLKALKTGHYKCSNCGETVFVRAATETTPKTPNPPPIQRKTIAKRAWHEFEYISPIVNALLWAFALIAYIAISLGLVAHAGWGDTSAGSPAECMLIWICMTIVLMGFRLALEIAQVLFDILAELRRPKHGG